MTLKELLRARRAIVNFSQEKLPVSTAYKLAKFISKTNDDESFYTAKFEQIINRYRKKDGDGNFIQDDENGIPISEEHFTDCQDEINELENTTVDCPTIKLNPDEFKGLNITIQEMLALEFLFEE